MTDAAHNQHSETRRPSDCDRIVTTGPAVSSPPVQKCCAEMMSVSVAGIPKNRCRTTLSLVGEAHLVEERCGALVYRGLAHAEYDPGRERHVGKHGLVREQLEVLEHHAHAPAHLAQAPLVAGERHAVQQDLAAVEGLEAVGAAEQGRFDGPAV